MKLEFLDDITDGGNYPDADPDKLIRLFDFDQEEAEQLVNTIQLWLVTKKEALDFSTLAFVQAANCSLIFEITSKDIGIDPSPDNKFVCRLSIESYRIMIGYIKVFADKGVNGFNWLYDPPDKKIDLLFSESGSW